MGADLLGDLDANDDGMLDHDEFMGHSQEIADLLKEAGVQFHFDNVEQIIEAVDFTACGSLTKPELIRCAVALHGCMVHGDPVAGSAVPAWHRSPPHDDEPLIGGER